jgi:hypothetical protein
MLHGVDGVVVWWCGGVRAIANERRLIHSIHSFLFFIHSPYKKRLNDVTHDGTFSYTS